MDYKKETSHFSLFILNFSLLIFLLFVFHFSFSTFNLLDSFVTKDQQGRWYFEKQDYRKAAERFQNPLWKGTAYYLNEDFKLAQEYFSRIDSTEGLFNMANSLAHGRNYVLASRVFEQILSQQGNHEAALNNKKILRKIMDEINMFSASQQAESGDSSRELGDEPQTAEGTETQLYEEQMIESIKQVTADEILQDVSINEMWLRRVQSDPANFLAIKFQMQLQAEQYSKVETADE